MKLEKLSALAEILAAVAVVATLIYLAIQTQQLTAQTRQNALALEAATRQATLDNVIDVLHQVMEDPDIWLNLVKDELDEAERIRASAYLFSITERTQASWFQYQSGALDEASWLQVRGPTVSNLLFAQVNRWWRYFQDGFDPAFRDHINSQIENREIVTELGESVAFD